MATNILYGILKPTIQALTSNFTNLVPLAAAFWKFSNALAEHCTIGMLIVQLIVQALICSSIIYGRFWDPVRFHNMGHHFFT